ncbi:MAG: 5-dehydro-2-deoxygluconokinase IolC [Chloroflexota bacterium]|jgi:5-dehydro-2-deoxygluconokinase
MTRTYDLLAMGRSSIDLYANDVGAAFVDIKSFAAYVGGCPTNISVAAQRLGSKTALLTAVGADQVGDFIVHFCDAEGIETRYTPRKPGHRSSAVVLGIEPPNKFPLTYYRDNCADIELTIDDVLASPIADAQYLLVSGTGFCKEPSRSATLFACEYARRHGTSVVLDIDFRPDQWHDPRAFGVTLRAALRTVDIVLGTEDEINAMMMGENATVTLTHSQISDARVSGDVDAAIDTILAMGPQVLFQKRGADGSRVHVVTPAGIDRVDAAGFPVSVYNILGAGDAYAGGVIHGLAHGWSYQRSARLGNACGAIVVTKHGCANFMPTMREIEAFMGLHGDL